jgi:hypothetical protein
MCAGALMRPWYSVWPWHFGHTNGSLMLMVLYMPWDIANFEMHQLGLWYKSKKKLRQIIAGASANDL